MEKDIEGYPDGVPENRSDRDPYDAQRERDLSEKCFGSRHVYIRLVNGARTFGQCECRRRERLDYDTLERVFGH